MKTHKWRDVQRAGMTAEEVAQSDREVERDILEMTLQELREKVGLTQEQPAKVAKMAQSELSRVETRTDHRISTLRRIIKALGGDLRVSAVFGDKEVRLEDV